MDGLRIILEVELMGPRDDMALGVSPGRWADGWPVSEAGQQSRGTSGEGGRGGDSHGLHFRPRHQGAEDWESERDERLRFSREPGSRAQTGGPRPSACLAIGRHPWRGIGRLLSWGFSQL